jgi:hypothetical protein
MEGESMKKTVLVLCLLAAVVALGFSPVFAQSGSRGMGSGKGGGLQTGKVNSQPDRIPPEYKKPSQPPSPGDRIMGVRYRVPQDYATIQAAIDACADGDTVLVSEGTYLENIRYKGKAIVVASLYLVDGDTTHIGNTIIDGSGSTDPDSGSVVYFIDGEDTTSVLCGFTIQGGYGTNKFFNDYNIWDRLGGGVFCDASGARLNKNYIKHNRIIAQCAEGGGLTALGTASFVPYLILEENRFTDNYVQSDSVNMWWGYGGGADIWGVSARVVGNLFERDTVVSIVGSAAGGMAIYSNFATRPLAEGYIQGNIFRKNILHATNQGAVGAGMIVQWTGEVTILENLFEDNEATSINSSGWAEGGGLCITDQDITGYGRKYVMKNRFVNNRVYSQYAWGDGGGLILFKTLGTFSGNEVIDNVATGAYGDGGGIWIYMSSFQLVNNIITRNSVNTYGGGINVEGYPQQGTEQVIVNNTFFDNNALNNSGGLRVAYGANVVALNNIFWADTANTNREISGSIQVYHSLIQDTAYSNINNGVFCADPLFADTLFHLSEQSPAVGRGVASLEVDGTVYQAPATDFEGNPRPSAADPLVDIGASESDYEGQAYISSFTLSDRFIYPETGTIHFTTDIINYHQQDIQLFSKFYNNDSSFKDSVELLDDGEHADGAAADGFYGGSYQTELEDIFTTFLVMENYDNESKSEYNSNDKFTTIGPVILAGYEITSVDTVPNPGDAIRLNFHLTNLSPTATARDISIKLMIAETLASVSKTPVEFGDIGPGITATGLNQRYIGLSDNFAYPQDLLPIVLEISSADYVFWYDSLSLVVGITGSPLNVPFVYSLNQNYPNPFNPVTVISYQLPVSSEVELSIYNLLGQKVATLVSGKQTLGTYNVNWDAGGFASGVYLYRLQAGDYVQTKKLILLR